MSSPSVSSSGQRGVVLVGWVLCAVHSYSGALGHSPDIAPRMSLRMSFYSSLERAGSYEVLAGATCSLAVTVATQPPTAHIIVPYVTHPRPSRDDCPYHRQPRRLSRCHRRHRLDLPLPIVGSVQMHGRSLGRLLEHLADWLGVSPSSTKTRKRV